MHFERRIIEAGLSESSSCHAVIVEMLLWRLYLYGWLFELLFNGVVVVCHSREDEDQETE